MSFKNDSSTEFHWSDIGDIALGRKNLGPMTYVSVYRALQYSLRKVMNSRLGIEEANKIIVEAGRIAGAEFAKNILNIGLPLNEFISDLHNKLVELKIGILRIESSDIENMNFSVTVEDDLDCSGLSFSDETVCEYDEGFLKGIFDAYFKKSFTVREIDCWANGGRVCRFSVTNDVV